MNSKISQCFKNSKLLGTCLEIFDHLRAAEDRILVWSPSLLLGIHDLVYSLLLSMDLWKWWEVTPLINTQGTIGHQLDGIISLVDYIHYLTLQSSAVIASIVNSNVGSISNSSRYRLPRNSLVGFGDEISMLPET